MGQTTIGGNQLILEIVSECIECEKCVKVKTDLMSLT